MVKVLLADTYSEMYFHKVCFLLKQNSIKFFIKIEDINNRYGLLGLDKVTKPSMSAKVHNKYKIYVQKSDYLISKGILSEVQNK